MKKIQQTYKSRGIKVISIAIDDAESRPEILKFVKQAKPNFPVIHDTDEAARKAFGVDPIPMNIALDRSGKIIATAGGEAAELDRAVAALMRSRVSRR